ncbi:hypothetical protein LOK49_LG01G00262 [Camellia lanceoleosa]|uniref:Uncharacterized protein n=1 Tax=Camellia lanceoleosa TaxID=1840588 RepID=A0ACC0IU66_9ERIC|nr:hypothetical protein LOK49_LG01G00262 [Camellia lanceoleosa]
MTSDKGSAIGLKLETIEQWLLSSSFSCLLNLPKLTTETPCFNLSTGFPILDKKKANDKKMEILEKACLQEQEQNRINQELEQERIRIMKAEIQERFHIKQEKIRAEQLKEEERIIMMDTNDFVSSSSAVNLFYCWPCCVGLLSNLLYCCSGPGSGSESIQTVIDTDWFKESTEGLNQWMDR